jgi:lysozyme family protein
MKITKYNEFLLEKEFQRILESLRLITESEDTYKLGDTIEWDLKKDKGTPDEPAPEMEWTFKPKSKIQKMKDKVSDFTNWLREDDPEIDWSDFSDGINPQNPIIMFKNFIEKIKDKEKIKEYFIRVIKQIKSLPTNIKRDLLKKLLIILAVYCNTINVPLSNIVTSDVTKTEPITAEIMTEIESGKEQQSTIKSNVDKKTSNVANFEMAQKMVKTAEAGYSDDRKDTGNYFEVPGGGYRFIGTNHGVSAPVLYQYFKDKGIDRLPTKQDMIDLTYDVALEIFKKDYWDRQHLGEIKNQPIATILYDGCINQGPGKFGGKEGVAEPLAKALVKIGEERPDSWSEVPSIVNGIEDEKDLKSLFKCIKRERWNRYSDAGTFDTHGDGWKNRLNNITYNKTIDTDKYDSEKDDVENDLSDLYGKLS